MAFDRIYYFDKNNFRRYLLGEIQTNFNLNIVIDGDKDSMQIDVHSYSRDALQPNTIIYHPNDPLQWFVVKKDNVKRNANEKGFYYIHSLTLNGAIDLLKNRDLTDCGFNANGYTIDEFFKKLLKLSNFEFEYEIDYGNNVDKDKLVDYIKSYENYTLLSAIRDFFNGYNCDVKLGFQTMIQVGYTHITQAIFKIIPRTGNVDITPIDISEFNDIRESINFDKESYGTTVISNAQNVVSTQAKTFPQVGGVNITGTDYDTNIDGAYIKLPSPAWKVNWVRAICPLTLHVYRNNDPQNDTAYSTIKVFPQDYKKAISSLIDEMYSTPHAGWDKDGVANFLNESEEQIKELFDNSSITFYNNPTYDPRTNFPSDSTNGSIIKENNTPYIAELDNNETYSDHRAHQVALMDKESASLMRNSDLALTWERGSNKVENIRSMMTSTVLNIHPMKSDYFNIGHYTISKQISGDTYTIIIYYQYGRPDGVNLQIIYQWLKKAETVFQVNYIPMSDLKVKQDNENNNNDIQLYNQNGKLNDSVALSKMVDSYSKEITHPTITRYGEYYNLNDIPKIGQIVMDGNIKYVINNISYNLYPCESDNQNNINYYCECEFTLAEFISTKSIMTSPNTNVRDYGIPQKYNIKRRQTYRDYYEFDFVEEPLANQDTPYTNLQNYLNFDYLSTINDFDHTALIKITYETEIGNTPQNTWYYQLNSTAYTMAKSVYEVIDFDDNNIIGYDIQNSTTGFNMSDLWSNQYRAVTTPVSYVDDNGKFVGITLLMVSKDNLEEVYSSINTHGESVMFSAHCFIDKTIYDNACMVESETAEDEREYTISVSTPMYLYSITVDLDSIGVPEDVVIDSNTFVGLIDTTFKANGNTITPTQIAPVVFDTQNRQITVLATFNNPISTFGSITGTLSASFKIKYLDEKNGLADYVIDEPTYEKDPIEVPVFEYSLQLGDTKDVEVGDNILLNRECIISPLNCVVSDGTITTLNATKYNGNMSASGGEYDQFEDRRIYQLNVGYVPVITLEENNTIMRIKFYTTQSFVITGNQDQTIETLEEALPLGQQMTKDSFIGKDITIYKQSINNIYRKDDTGSISLDYATDLMMIIHRPTEEQFDDDDLIICINHYRLK